MNETPLLLVSVMHSGTRFFMDLLDLNDKHGAQWHLHKKDVLQDVANADIVACTVRRPEDVLESWLRRDRHIGNGTYRANKLRIKWGWAWENMAALPEDTFFLPIDHESRDERLQRLSERLGRPLEPDWGRKVGEHPGERAEIPENIDINWIYETVPIVRELYATT